MVGAAAISRCSHELQKACPLPAPGDSAGVATGGEMLLSTDPILAAVQALDVAVDKFRGFMERLACRCCSPGAPPGSSRRPTGKFTILLVEDTHIIREILVHRLEENGCRVTAVNNGADALAILRETRFSCVFCDMHMPPGPDGLMTMAQLRKYEDEAGRPAQPAYLLTANVSDPSLEQRAAGLVLGVVDKQLPVEQLVAIARAAQAGARA